MPAVNHRMDAVDIKSRQAKEIPAGTALAGAGFVVKAPEGHLYPVKNLSLKGASGRAVRKLNSRGGAGEVSAGGPLVRNHVVVRDSFGQ